MSKTVIAVLAIGVLGIIAFVILRQKNAPQILQASTGAPIAGAATRTGSKVTNTINDIFGFANQGIDIANKWANKTF